MSKRTILLAFCTLFFAGASLANASTTELNVACEKCKKCGCKPGGKSKKNTESQSSE